MATLRGSHWHRIIRNQDQACLQRARCGPRARGTGAAYIDMAAQAPLEVYRILRRSWLAFPPTMLPASPSMATATPLQSPVHRALRWVTLTEARCPSLALLSRSLDMGLPPLTKIGR